MATVQCVKILKLNLKDEPGALLSIMQGLKAKNISLKSLWGFGKQGGDAELLVFAKDTEKIKSLWTASGYTVEELKAFFIKGTDKAGALLKNLEALANQSINIKSMFAVAVSGKYGSMLCVEEKDIEKAAQALNAK